MTQSFAELFEESLKTIDMKAGSIITGVVVDIDSEWVTVHAGLKSEGVIPRIQFLDESGELEVNIGDAVQVSMDAVDDGFGETRLSREKAKRAESWQMLERVFEAQEVIKGQISGRVKGGFTVEIRDVRAFLPGSLVDVRPLRETEHLEGRELEFKVIKLDQKRNNVVVSRRAVLEEENSAEREQLLESLQEGQEVKGIVKNLTDYGAFVDLGGVDGLLHITDMAWKRIKHPSEIVEVGQEISVKILKFDRERNRVSLGLKQLGEDPWVLITNRYPEGTRTTAKVTNLTDYGCFAELEEGVEGLVHVSEMDWTNRNIHPSKVVQVGDEVEVMVLDIDEERRRISLGIKQCQGNPWEEFAVLHNKGDHLKGYIKSITDFGIFIGLDGNIDGLVHLSDISWNEPGETAVRRFTKGDEIETTILSIDAERERISLGLKQLEEDPFTNYVAVNDRNAIVKGKVKEVDAKQAIIELAEEVDGLLKASEISLDRVEDARNALSVGDEIEVKIISVDRKNRGLGVSIKAKDMADEVEAVKAHREKEVEVSPTTIGDLIKQQMDQGKSE
ncbi:MAG: 30S ribosomal protein S1 [Gammaproteobacteria bacterium]|nr:30S ribosomal protein S1 [Gammaproteobacteria bacterium]MDA7833828.1 30S ribosomal protein S1 [Pseudomonadales bacterium]MBT3737184.1 30S ribosomal protein S1 [Gammaproteobacteria bacterium]MBT3900607.1 30S ribosomal protein S1 [Gammaproteobacteria bacterium]MBT7539596.1 30S ribosomal protein S1 [Gammaproteobacteria bacterium]